MTGGVEMSDPVVAAECAAEAVRILNRLTISPPSRGTEGWEDVTDIYRVVAEARVLTERLPQVMQQVAGHLLRSSGVGYRCDAGTSETAEDLVLCAVGVLDDASDLLSEAGSDLGAAQEALAHLAPGDGTLAGHPSQGGRREPTTRERDLGARP